MDEQQKKRNRLSLSCNYCKKRKVKCDRGRPCSLCVKYNVGMLCTYPDPVWGSNPVDDNLNNGSLFLVQVLPQREGMVCTNSFGGTETLFQLAEQNDAKHEPEQVHKEKARKRDREFTGKELKIVHEPLPQTWSSGSRSPPNVGTASVVSFASVPSVSTVPYVPQDYQFQAEPQSGVHSELAKLKDKIREIEDTIRVEGQIKENQTKPNQVNNFQNVHADLLNTAAVPFAPATAPAVFSSALPYGSSAPLTASTPGYQVPKINTGFYRTVNHVPITLPPIWLAQGRAPTPPALPTPARTTSSGALVSLSSRQEHVTQETHNPSLLGINAYSSETDTINFYEGYTPIYMKDISRRKNFGPLSWLAVIKHDPALEKLCEFLCLFLDKPTRAAISKAMNVHETEGKSRIAEKKLTDQKAKDLKHEITEGQKNSTIAVNVLLKDSIEMNKSALVLGVSSLESELDLERRLVDRIELILPTQKILWTLINRFFESVYPYMPFLDEETFKSDITRIIGPEGYDDIKLEPLKIDMKLEFAILGTLLLVLRLTYVSLTTNVTGMDEEKNTSDPVALLLLENPVGPKATIMAQLCMDQFDLLRRTNLVVLQLAMYVRMVQVYDPEDGDGADGGNSQIFNGVLLQMAYSLGLNREPDYLHGMIQDDGKANNLGRKIWCHLMIADTEHSFKFGTPTLIAGRYHDTKLPYYIAGIENVKDVKLEQRVIASFSYFEIYYARLMEIVDMCMDLRGRHKVSHLTELVSHFEMFLEFVG